jgi:hypothetical protein
MWEEAMARGTYHRLPSLLVHAAELAAFRRAPADHIPPEVGVHSFREDMGSERLHPS